MSNAHPKARYKIRYDAAGKQWDVPLINDITATFGQVQVHHESDGAGGTKLTFSLSAGDKAAVVEICYRHIADTTFSVTVCEIVASHTPGAANSR